MTSSVRRSAVALVLAGVAWVWHGLLWHEPLGSSQGLSRQDRTLDIYWIDVEGGAATLVVTPAGESVLVDTGYPGDRDADRIARVVREEAKLERLDHVIVTHLHNDHFGGLADLVKRLPVGVLYENGIDSAAERERGQAIVPAFRDAPVGRRIIVQPGDRLPLKQAEVAPAVEWRILGARQQFVPAAGDPNPACADLRREAPDTTDNANSIVSLVSFGDFRFFDGGDLTWNLEGELVCPSDRVGPVDLFQIDHHGLDVSNNPVLLATLRPSVVVFNNGPQKGAEPRSFATVAETSSVAGVYQVHRNLTHPGSNTEAERIAITEAEADCPGGFIKASIDPDGQSYEVIVPSTGHRQTYQTGSNDLRF